MKNFSKTAAMLHMTQPAFSRVIAKAESEIGFKIFDRDNKAVSLTPAGVSFIDTISQVKGVYESGLYYSKIMSDSRKQLVIGCAAIFAELPLAKKYMSFYAEHRDIEMNIITMHSEDIIPQIINGHLDMGVLFNNFEYGNEALEAIELADIRLNIIVSKYNPLSNKEVINSDDLSGQKLLALPIKGESYDIGSYGNPYEILKDKYDINLSPSYIGHSIQDILLRVACNQGVAFMAETLGKLLPEGVKMIPLDKEVIYHLRVIWNNKIDNLIRDEFISLLDIGSHYYYF